MEVLTYISCMDTAYVREGKPTPNIAEHKVQYLHFEVPEMFGDSMTTADGSWRVLVGAGTSPNISGTKNGGRY